MPVTQASPSENPKRKTASRKKVAPKDAGSPATATPIASDPAPERVTKHDRVLTLLSRRDGATILDLMEETGWQQHSVRGFLAGTVKKKLGLELTSFKVEGELRRYSIKTKLGR